MEAIPRGLVSREQMKMIPGIKCVRTNILPANSSGNYSFSASSNNRITLQVPSFPNSYINGKRSFIRFILKTSSNGVLVPQANIFRRMLLKSSRGQVLEDIDNYDMLCRIQQNLKSEATLKGEAFSSKDIRAVDVAKNFGNMTNATGQNMRHHLQSGILGDHQEFLIPVSSMVASSGFAFQLELFLNDDAKVVGSTNTSPASYSLEEVSYDMELVEVSDAIMADINSELSSGSQIPLPYKSWRSHNTALSGAGTQHKVDIAESAINAEKIYSVVVPQSWTQKQSVDATKYLGTDYDPYTFYGGRKKLSASGAFTSPTDYVTKYNWRYGSTYYPSAPIELNQDSTVALETTLSTFDLKGNELPFMTAQETDGSGATNRFESRDFILAHNFNKTPEKMRAGLNLANSGAPVSLSLHFNSNPNASVAKAIQTFIESSNTLYIKPDGASSLVAN
jgi:hypothetical protein